MTKVTFLRDFRGRATAEVFYHKSQTVDLPEWQAAACVAEGAAVVVLAASASTPPVVEAGTAEVQSPSPAVPAVAVKPRRVRRKKNEPDE